jgi:uncharacterized protein
MDAELMKILCCPETRQELRPAEAPLLETLNQEIAAGRLRNRAGSPVKEPIEAGLVRADGKFLYVIRRNLPIMLVDEAVSLEILL